MQYTARLPFIPSPRSLAAPVAALAVGAAVATGAWALIDNETTVVQEPAQVIVLDTPAPAGPGLSAKNEAATAAALASAPALELRGSKASATGTSSTETEQTPARSHGPDAPDPVTERGAAQGRRRRPSEARSSAVTSRQTQRAALPSMLAPPLPPPSAA